jgi:hypothetical protein
MTKLLDFRLCHEWGCGTYLPIVAYYEDLPSPQQCWQFCHIGLRRFVDNDKVQRAEIGRELLRNAPGRHDPTRNRIVTARHGLARSAPVPPGRYACSLANSREGTNEFDKGGFDGRRQAPVQFIKSSLAHEFRKQLAASLVGILALSREGGQSVAGVDGCKLGVCGGMVPSVTPVASQYGIIVQGRFSARSFCPARSARLVNEFGDANDRRKVSGAGLDAGYIINTWRK